MKIKKEELQKILEDLRPGLAKRDIVSRLSDFTFFGDRIGTFNDQVSISHPFEFEPQCSVDGSSFYAVVVNSPGEIIDLSIKDSSLIIKGEKSKAVLKTSESIAIDKIKVPKINSKKWKPLPKSFSKGIKLCSFSVSKDLTRPALICVAIKDNKIFSSDGLRISRFELSKGLGEEFLIAGEAAGTLAKYSPTQYLKEDSWVHFKTESNIIFSCRVITGTFPDVDKHFGIEGRSVSLPKELKDVIDSVSIVTDEEFSVDRIVCVSVKGKAITCSGSGSQGSFERTCSMEKDTEEDFEFIVNPAFFSEVLEEGLTMTVGMQHALFERGPFDHVMCLPIKKEPV